MKSTESEDERSALAWQTLEPPTEHPRPILGGGKNGVVLLPRRRRCHRRPRHRMRESIMDSDCPSQADRQWERTNLHLWGWQASLHGSHMPMFGRLGVDVHRRNVPMH